MSALRKPLLLLLASCLSALLILGVSGCGQLMNGRDAPRDAEGKVTASATAAAMKVRVGDCLQNPGITPSSEENPKATTVTADEIVQQPCNQPYDFQVFNSTTLDAETFPGESSLKDSAAAFCKPAFKEFIGRPFAQSVLQLNYLYPTKNSWNDGDRKILCLVGGQDGAQSSGTLQGVNR